MAAIGTGWVDGAWVEAGWITEAWDQEAFVPDYPISIDGALNTTITTDNGSIRLYYRKTGKYFTW